MKQYMCDGCGLQSTLEEDVPTYKMFVCDNYEGEDIMLCLQCENKVKLIWEKRCKG